MVAKSSIERAKQLLGFSRNWTPVGIAYSLNFYLHA